MPLTSIAACTAILGDDFKVSATGGPSSMDSGVQPDGGPGNTGDTGTTGETGTTSETGTTTESGVDPCGGCGPQGKCTNGACVCDPKTMGPHCGVCAPGFQDNDKNNVCEADCRQIACPGAHASCNETSGTAKCECALGYVPTGAVPPCKWRGVVADPTFELLPPSGWTLGVSAPMKIDAMGQGSLERGWLDAQQLAICPGVGMNTPEASQMFDMPLAAQAEALSLQVVAKSLVSGGAGIVNMSASMGPFHVNWPMNSAAFEMKKICLGELQYGKGQDLRFSFAASNMCNPGTYEAFIDHASIDPDPACPAPGTVFNGDFQAPAPGGWTSDTTQQGNAAVEMVGVNGTLAAHLYSFQTCKRSSITGLWSPPLNMANAALLLSYKGTSTRNLQLSVDGPGGKGRIAGNMTGSGGFDTVTVCVPQHAKGYVGRFSIDMPNDFKKVTDSCGAPVADSRDYVVDDLRFASSPLCAGSDLVIDGGFERSDPGTPWNIDRLPISGFGGDLEFDASKAHSGMGRARINSKTPGNFATMTQTISVPLRQPGKPGPAVTFFYKTEVSGTAALFRVSGPHAASGNDLPVSPSAWKASTVCFDQQFFGRSVDLSFQVLPQDTSAAAPQQYLEIDDVSILGTDPTCL